MNPLENQKPQKHKHIKEFLLVSSDPGIHHITLMGPADTITNVTGYVAVFLDDRTITVLDPISSPDVTPEFLDTLLALKIPPEMNTTQFIDDQGERERMQRYITAHGMPLVVIASGTSRTQQEKIELCFVNGIRPENALRVMQDMIRTVRARLS